MSRDFSAALLNSVQAGVGIRRKVKQMRRLILTCTLTLVLTMSSISVPVIATDNVLALLSCSDGNEVTLEVDLATITELTSAIAAMSGSGLECSLTQLPTGTALFGLVAVAASPKDFAVGGVTYVYALPGAYPAGCSSLGNLGGVVEFVTGLSAHVQADGQDPETATGSISQTIHDPAGGPCQGDRRKVHVTCLGVSVKDAWMEGDVTQATGFFAGSLTHAYSVRDGLPDQVNENRNAENCPTRSLVPAFDVIRGNFVVKDR